MLGRQAYYYPTDPGGSVFGFTLGQFHIEALRLLIFPWIHEAAERIPGWDKDRLFSIAKIISNRLNASGSPFRKRIKLVLQEIHGGDEDELLTWLVELSHARGVLSWTWDSKRLDSVIAIAARMKNDLLPPEPEPPKSRTCDVCLQEHPIEEFPEIPITPNCNHETSICLTAVSEHIRATLDHLQHNTLTCPLCPENLDASDVQRWASDETFFTYCNKAFHAYIRSEPNLHHCLAEGCGSGQIHEDGPLANKPKMRCNACKAYTCVRHAIPWHTGLTCDQYDERQRLNRQHAEEEEASLALIASTSKDCPGCGVSIEKNLGCDHFTCVCRHTLCWECLAPWAPIYDLGTNNAWRGHKDGCPYHRVGMPLHAPMDLDHYLRGVPTDYT